MSKREWLRQLKKEQGEARFKSAFGEAYEAARKAVLAGRDIDLVLRSPRRSNAQNSALWAILADVAEQLDLVVNGRPQKASSEDWKAVFYAAWSNENRMALGVDGSVVFLGGRTSKLDREQFGELLTIIRAHGDQSGVRWSDPALQSFEQYREAQQ